MVKLELAGVHTHLSSPLCSRCPQGRAGCCAAPPAMAWADIGRVVSLGGRDWLLSQIDAGDLRPIARGLAMRRVPAAEAGGEAFPARCTYHGPTGCTIPPSRRSATCNYYICGDAFDDGDRHADTAQARDAHERLMSMYGRWDLEMKEAIDARFPQGPPWDGAFLDWVGEVWRARAKGARRALRVLEPTRAARGAAR
jgi:hypothetical protein